MGWKFSQGIRSRLPYIFIPVLAWFFYSGLLAPGQNALRTNDEEWNYFKQLAYSLLHARLDIDCPPRSNCHDLVNYNGKHYLYWPPAPALLYVPIVAVAGTGIPDPLIAATFGALNILLLMLFVRGFIRRYLKTPELPAVVFVALFWAFGTVHFYMAMNGTVWFISQVVAQTFLLSSLLIFMKPHTPGRLLFAGVFFGLACYTRNHLVFSAFLFGAIYFTTHTWDLKKYARDAAYFYLPFFMFSMLNMAYNYERFGDVLQNGIPYHQMGGHFIEKFNEHGYFSLHFIPDNFIREVIYFPEIVSQFPWFAHDEEGFGLLWASPVFLLLLPALFIYAWKVLGEPSRVKKIRLSSKPELRLMTGNLLAALFISLVIFSIMGTGWVQFASRYSLDYQLFLILFLLLTFRNILHKPAFKIMLVVLLMISVFMNYYGAKMFYEISQP
jgi:hypothetical protein